MKWLNASPSTVLEHGWAVLLLILVIGSNRLFEFDVESSLGAGFVGLWVAELLIAPTALLSGRFKRYGDGPVSSTYGAR